jgi:hypothetical protein
MNPEPRPTTSTEPMRELLYAIPAGLIIAATASLTVLLGWSVIIALGEVVSPPPIDPNELNKQAADETDVILLTLMTLAAGSAVFAAVRCWVSRRWLILAVPVALAPVLLGLFVLLALNNWQY